MWVKRNGTYVFQEFRKEPEYSIQRADPFREDKRQHRLRGQTGVFEGFDNYLRPPLYLELRKINVGIAERYRELLHQRGPDGAIDSNDTKFRWRKQRDLFFKRLFNTNFPKIWRDKIIVSLNRVYKRSLKRRSFK